MSSQLTIGTQNRSTLPGLELLRALACLEVLLLHLPWQNTRSLILVHWLIGGWGEQAVIVFFVLSGFVISLSQERNKRSFAGFMRARFRRLLPLYLVALMITVPLEIWLHPETRIFDATLLHLAFLQYGDYKFQSNIPLWSLSYEFYFYLLFALTMGRWQIPLRLIWFLLGLGAVAASSLGILFPGFLGHLDGILAYSPIWLLGSVLIYEPKLLHFDLKQSLVLLGLVPLLANLPPIPGMPGSGALASLLTGFLVAPLVCYLARLPRESSSSRPAILWASIAGLYLLLAAFFLLTASWGNSHIIKLISVAFAPAFFFVPTVYRFLFRNRPFFNPFITALSLTMGKLSYAVYIIHWPLLILATALISNVSLRLAIVLPIILGFAWFMEFYLQPWMEAWFDTIWPLAPKTRKQEAVPLPSPVAGN